MKYSRTRNSSDTSTRSSSPRGTSCTRKRRDSNDYVLCGRWWLDGVNWIQIMELSAYNNWRCNQKGSRANTSNRSNWQARRRTSPIASSLPMSSWTSSTRQSWRSTTSAWLKWSTSSVTPSLLRQEQAYEGHGRSHLHQHRFGLAIQQYLQHWGWFPQATHGWYCAACAAWWLRRQ